MIINRAGIRAMKRGILAVFLILTMSSATQAGPLGVKIDPYPSITLEYMTHNYDVLTGAFTAIGWATNLATSATSGEFIIAPFSLVATIDRDGKASTNATLTLGDPGFPMLLFSQNLLNFGFDPTPGGALEFLFAPGVSGSYVTSGLYSAVKPLDVLMVGLGTDFRGNFHESWFSSSNVGSIKEDSPLDGVRVPEASTLLLLLAGVGITGAFANARTEGVQS
jgi:hypothetical protein